jgi:hypothetical protein
MLQVRRRQGLFFAGRDDLLLDRQSLFLGGCHCIDRQAATREIRQKEVKDTGARGRYRDGGIDRKDRREEEVRLSLSGQLHLYVW